MQAASAAFTPATRGRMAALSLPLRAPPPAAAPPPLPGAAAAPTRPLRSALLARPAVQPAAMAWVASLKPGTSMEAAWGPIRPGGEGGGGNRKEEAIKRGKEAGCMDFEAEGHRSRDTGAGGTTAEVTKTGEEGAHSPDRGIRAPTSTRQSETSSRAASRGTAGGAGAGRPLAALLPTAVNCRGGEKGKGRHNAMGNTTIPLHGVSHQEGLGFGGNPAHSHAAVPGGLLHPQPPH